MLRIAYKSIGSVWRRSVASITRVRFAPSPTGYMHIGGLRTALINYLYAKKNGGQFILRIEDTDRHRIVNGSIEDIVNSLDIFQLYPDESVKKGGPYGPYIQSERLQLYKDYAFELVEKQKAYICFCHNRNTNEKGLPCSCSYLSLSESKDRIKKGEKYTIRLKMEKRDYVLHDTLRGTITIHGDEIDDCVLLKSDGYPTYHLASVVDDHLMCISTVIRGEEWISSTPKHIQLYEALEWDIPEFIHLPLLLSEKHTKISKREGGFELRELLRQGYLPSALVNYIFYLGLRRGDDKVQADNGVFFSLDTLIPAFSVAKLSSAPVCINSKLLKHLNALHIHHQFTNHPAW